MLSAALGVIFWPLLAPGLGCMSSALYIAPFWLLIAVATVESAVLRRRAFVGFYLSADGGLGRLLRPGLLLWALQGLKSGFFVLLLMVGALGLNHGQKWLLLSDVVILLLIQALVGRWFGGQLRGDIRQSLIRHWAHWVNALLLWLALPAMSLLSYRTDYAGMKWDQAMLVAAGQVQAGCDALAMLGRLQAATTALPGWTVQNLLPQSAGPDRVLVAWLLLFASVGVSFLFAWAYSRLLSGVTARPFSLLPQDRTAP